MGRGFLRGVIWGVAVAAGTLVVLVQLAPPPPPAAPLETVAPGGSVAQAPDAGGAAPLTEAAAAKPDPASTVAAGGAASVEAGADGEGTAAAAPPRLTDGAPVIAGEAEALPGAVAEGAKAAAAAPQEGEGADRVAGAAARPETEPGAPVAALAGEDGATATESVAIAAAPAPVPSPEVLAEAPEAAPRPQVVASVAAAPARAPAPRPSTEAPQVPAALPPGDTGAAAPLAPPAPVAEPQAPAVPDTPVRAAAAPVLPAPGEGAAVSRAPAPPAPVILAETSPPAAEGPPPPPLTPEEAALVATAPPPETLGEVPPEAPAILLVEDAPPVVIVVPETGTGTGSEAAQADTGAGGAPPAATLAQAPAEAPAILTRPEPLPSAAGLAPEVAGVTTGRLPRIGADAAPASDAAPAAAPAPDGRPLQRHARPFDNPAAKPVFAIVLVDTGGPTLDRAALAALPFPVTFALDPTAPEAELAATIYRAAGQEVVMLATAIPEGATAGDLEQTFAAHAAVLPEAVAVMDPEAGGFQGNRVLATLVVPIVADDGRGILSWDRGLNAASQVARREGVASGVIFRRLDGEDEGAPIIRRYLDRAAFKAVQDGRVIVAGETRPETVAALLAWAVEGRAATVALAPLSAALQAQ